MIQKIFQVFLLSVCALIGHAQEINAQFKVNTPKLQTTDPKVFRSLEDDASQFINTRVWTNDKFKIHERIKCNFILTIREEVNSSTFKADLTISASRPVFGSSYETTIINYMDRNVVINYEPNRPLNYVQNAFSDRLTSLMAFYVHLILGLDYDSFAANGGSDYFTICQNIVNTIPSTMSGEGWLPGDDNRNRYWLLENIMSPRLRSMRTAWYAYHRQGLDIMAQNSTEGRATIAKALETIDIVKRNYPTALWIQVFVDAKTTEIVEIFKKGDKPQQQSVHNILSRLDPSSASKFKPLLQ